ncbi:hypothetical protein Cpir12675_006953, partial [Ceratocystis pirilliformis]
MAQERSHDNPLEPSAAFRHAELATLWELKILSEFMVLDGSLVSEPVLEGLSEVFLEPPLRSRQGHGVVRGFDRGAFCQSVCLLISFNILMTWDPDAVNLEIWENFSEVLGYGLGMISLMLRGAGLLCHRVHPFYRRL